MDDRIQLVEAGLRASVEALRFDDTLKAQILQAADMLLDAHRNGRGVYIFGNGGSAADAEHFSCELVGRFLREREPVNVHALTANSSTLTSLLNDYPADRLFERQVRAHAAAGDVAVGISTSGRSANVINGLREARRRGARAIGISGETGGDLAPECDLLLKAPARATPRIQEAHIFIIHAICQLVENAIADE